MFKKTFFLLLLFFTSCSVLKTKIPQPKTEFRGVWVATVVNIDWPKSGFDAIEKQKKDYLNILNFYKDLNFNCVIVQIRTAGDAFYDSTYAPWSRFLTGEEGKTPENINLLNWMINEAHNRGMEFHAWLNPYRATFDLKTEILHLEHDYFQHPDWMVKYGKKYYYNPGLPEIQERFTCIIDEIVSNYDIDAIHFDDYFYPYSIKNEIFNDSLVYNKHKQPNQSLADWRRSNIDSLVKKTHQTIKKVKPWVQFGISPFGVWQNKSTNPNGSDTKAGQTSYNDLYADPLLWMEQNWIDYIIPQVYWSMDLPVASHKKIVDWWNVKTVNTNLYVGNSLYKIRNNSDKAWNNKKELPNQISYARNASKVNGNAFFSAKWLIDTNTDVAKYIKRKLYKYPALPPSFGSKTLLFDVKKIEKNKTHLLLYIKNLNNFRYALVYKGKDTSFMKKLFIKQHISTPDYIQIPLKNLKGKNRIAITLIDNYGTESAPILLHLKQIKSK